MVWFFISIFSMLITLILRKLGTYVISLVEEPQTLDPVIELTALEITSTSFTIAWKLSQGDVGNGDTLYCHIDVTDMEGRRVEHHSKVNCTVPNFRVLTLTPDHVYKVAIGAVLREEVAPSVTIFVKTGPTASPTASPTPSPTASPTASPTPSPKCTYVYIHMSVLVSIPWSPAHLAGSLLQTLAVLLDYHLVNIIIMHNGQVLSILPLIKYSIKMSGNIISFFRLQCLRSSQTV